MFGKAAVRARMGNSAILAAARAGRAARDAGNLPLSRYMLENKARRDLRQTFPRPPVGRG